MTKKIISFPGHNTPLSEVKKNLRVAGFEQQSLVNTEALKNTINKIPDAHLRGLQVIKYDPSRNIQRLRAFYNGGFSGAPSAEYLNQYNSVVVYAFKDLHQFRHIIYHEVGHFVFYKVISSFTKKEWVTQVYPNSSFVTEYAKRNACEDFAESYATYLNEPDRLRTIPKKFHFMQNKVFAV